MVLSYVSNLVPGEKLQVGPILYISVNKFFINQIRVGIS